MCYNLIPARFQGITEVDEGGHQGKGKEMFKVVFGRVGQGRTGGQSYPVLFLFRFPLELHTTQRDVLRKHSGRVVVRLGRWASGRKTGLAYQHLSQALRGGGRSRTSFSLGWQTRKAMKVVLREAMVFGRGQAI